MKQIFSQERENENKAFVSFEIFTLLFESFSKSKDIYLNYSTSFNWQKWARITFKYNQKCKIVREDFIFEERIKSIEKKVDMFKNAD